MDILVHFSIRKREFGDQVTDEAKKIFEKIKEKPDLAEELSAKELPSRTTLHKQCIRSFCYPSRLIL